MRTAVVWIALVVTFGCGGDGRPEIGTSHQSVCDEVAEVACYNLYQCCSEGEIEDFLGVSEPRTEAECFDDVRTRCQRQLAALDFSFKNNHVRFDAAILDRCLEALVPPEDTCATISSVVPWTEACMENAWVGTVADGGQCDFAIECGQDSFCNTGRICTALPTADMPCSPRGCASGLFCDFDDLCRTRITEGGACLASFECADGLFCDFATPSPACAPLRELGEQCTSSANCKSDTCLPGMCADTGTACFSSATCNGRCADDNMPCTADSSCAAGTCTGTATTCFSPFDCIAPATCDFPVRCVRAECLGDIVCAEGRIVVDYCVGALNSLPFVGNR
jgi:hypothetical protein